VPEGSWIWKVHLWSKLLGQARFVRLADNTRASYPRVESRFVLLIDPHEGKLGGPNISKGGESRGSVCMWKEGSFSLKGKQISLPGQRGMLVEARCLERKTRRKRCWETKSRRQGNIKKKNPPGTSGRGGEECHCERVASLFFSKMDNEHTTAGCVDFVSDDRLYKNRPQRGKISRKKKIENVVYLLLY